MCYNKGMINENLKRLLGERGIAAPDTPGTNAMQQDSAPEQPMPQAPTAEQPMGMPNQSEPEPSVAGPMDTLGGEQNEAMTIVQILGNRLNQLEKGNQNPPL